MTKLNFLGLTAGLSLTLAACSQSELVHSGVQQDRAHQTAALHSMAVSKVQTFQNLKTLGGAGNCLVGVEEHGKVVLYSGNIHPDLDPCQSLNDIPFHLRHGLHVVHPVTSVAVAKDFGIALRENGALEIWGISDNADLIKATLPSQVSGRYTKAIAVGVEHAVALTKDGSVFGWGGYGPQQLLFANDHAEKEIKAIASGDYECLGLTLDGRVISWTNYVARGVEVYLSGSILKDVIRIAAGAKHNLALKRDGTVVSWRDNTYGQTDVPKGLENVIAIAAGAEHNLALKGDGTVVGWGSNEYGQLNIPPTLKKVRSITAFGHTSVALQEDGQFVTWGDSTFVQRK